MNINALQTLLFVPANRPERFEKALNSGADAIIIDLEDAVPPAEKDAARSTLANWLAEQPSASVLIRINGTNTPWFNQDTVLCRSDAVAAIVVPKAEDPGALTELANACDKPLLPFIESARALFLLNDIATVNGVARLLFGQLDMALDLGMDYPPPAGEPYDETPFLPIRSQLVVCSRAHGLAAPLDAVYTAFNDDQGLQAYVHEGMKLGFDGILLVHPRQVRPATQAMAPTEAQIVWAGKVLAAGQQHNGAVVAVSEHMVDSPVITRARRILQHKRH
ncbi:HpcH/HpaI aldolase/citrate lyase family protein [Oceanimonas baumannii]|uniref:Citrate lyase subunit beta/citryl-CoA lyase/(S)-citramalyl-CoA lyase n=1 Tax=Oceanimonas baumannii TaxID=129578 RepID=A0A235CML8_9GAMM|nr:CoA ester lyase [Oceanimonas baumannii]OYD25802.1 CoA ester lyase [Oceanimonas baumannii]TDW60186.1 citrate lyase subunit beta/citryl-CoA lyase/(S)-citramalyl-CoA lyase [Oceanimonas baumannii]